MTSIFRSIYAHLKSASISYCSFVVNNDSVDIQYFWKKPKSTIIKSAGLTVRHAYQQQGSVRNCPNVRFCPKIHLVKNFKLLLISTAVTENVPMWQTFIYLLFFKLADVTNCLLSIYFLSKVYIKLVIHKNFPKSSFT